MSGDEFEIWRCDVMRRLLSARQLSGWDECLVSGEWRFLRCSLLEIAIGTLIGSDLMWRSAPSWVRLSASVCVPNACLPMGKYWTRVRGDTCFISDSSLIMIAILSLAIIVSRAAGQDSTCGMIMVSSCLQVFSADALAPTSGRGTHL
jgi:hypothetical protein